VGAQRAFGGIDGKRSAPPWSRADDDHPFAPPFRVGVVPAIIRPSGDGIGSWKPGGSDSTGRVESSNTELGSPPSMAILRICAPVVA